MSDDWKGESKISAKGQKYETGCETRRMNNVIYHQKRRAAGAPTPAAQKHTRFLKTVFATLKTLESET